MDLYHLLYFKKVAEMSNITKASESLSITQPALSRVIHNLENELGYKLFDRNGKNIVLNRKGEVFLRFTNSTFELLEQAKSEMKSIEMQENSCVSLVMKTAVSLLPYLIKGFKEAHPDIIINIKPHIGDERESRNADVVIDVTLEKPENMNTTVLLEEGSKILLSKQLLDSYGDNVNLKTFEKESFFVLTGSV